MSESRKTWRDVERASLHCVALRVAVEMVRNGDSIVTALIEASLYLSDQNRRLIDAEIQRRANAPFGLVLVSVPPDAHLGAVGGE